MTTTNIQEQLCRQWSSKLHFKIIAPLSFLHGVSLKPKTWLSLPNSTLTAFGIHIFVLHGTILLQCFCHSDTCTNCTVACAVPFITSYLASAFKWGLHECCLISRVSLVSVMISGTWVHFRTVLFCSNLFHKLFQVILFGCPDSPLITCVAWFTNILDHQMNKFKS